MKNLIFYILPIAVLLACNTPQNAQQPTQKNSAPFVEWDKKSIALGAVKKGETREMFFEFTNTSGEPIQIDIVDACECTTTDFPRGVLAPGQKGRIDATFDSKEKEASETIEIRVIFKNSELNGMPKFEVLQYTFELVK
jgi:hypothetical protein